MSRFDLVIRGGTVATAADTFAADVGIRDGRIVALAGDLGEGGDEIDATGKLVLPGGIDSHCHIEQKSAAGILCADDFHSGSVSAAFGGTTTIIPFAAQHRGQSLREVVEPTTPARAPRRSWTMLSTSSSPTPPRRSSARSSPRSSRTATLVQGVHDLRPAPARRLPDARRALARAARGRDDHGARREPRHDPVAYRPALDGGHRAPKYHAVSHARIAESEATSRAIDLARLIDVPMLIVHVSGAEAADAIRRAQDRGLRIYGETCPQYLFLTAADLDRDGMEGAKFCCSPPPRDAANQEHVWRGLVNGTFQVFSSDHAPYRFDESGKLAGGPDASFKQIANGVPGIELRLPLLFSEGVGGGRIDLNRFVALASTNAARLYGLYRARAPSRSAPTRTSRFGTRSARSRSRGTTCTTTLDTPPTRAGASRGGR